MNEQEFIQSVETGLPVASLSFSELRKKTNLRTALRCVYAKFLYMLRLYVLRECAIMICLLKNSDKIPKHTPSAAIVSLLKTSRALKTAVFKLEKKLRRSLINYS